MVRTWPNQSGGAGWMDMVQPLNQVGEWFVDTIKKKKEGERYSKRGGSRLAKIPVRSQKLHDWVQKEKLNKPKFYKNVPMSNFDLLDWCKYLKIPIKNVLSRDQTVPHQHKLALFIYNLEPHYMSGNHWVTTYVRNGTINYFDSFGMPPFQELVNHAKEKNLTLLHQNGQIQNLYTTACGYYCLYFLNEMHKGVDYFHLLQVFDTDTKENEKFIENYFKLLL